MPRRRSVSQAARAPQPGVREGGASVAAGRQARGELVTSDGAPAFRGTEEERRFSAVLGIIAAVNVPIVIFSIKLLDNTQQLHPEVVAKQGLRDISFVYTLVSANVFLIVAAFWFMMVQLRRLLIAQSVTDLRRIFHSRS